MDMRKIEKLARLPRPLDETVQTIWKKPFFFRKSWERDMSSSPLVFLYVVQANECLFEAGEGDMAPAVVLYTTDPLRALDVAWLNDLGRRIYALKSSGTEDQEANLLGCYLVAENSRFNLPVPKSLTGGVAATIRTWTLGTFLLPDKRIGPDRIVPALVTKNGFIMIPCELYA